MLHSLPLALHLIGCSDLPAATGDDVVSRTDLSALGILAGVTVEPDTGRRMVLAGNQLYVVGPEGTEPLAVQPDPERRFTDVVAVGDGVVALSAESDGYLFHTVTGKLIQHFCYEPGWQDTSAFQVSFALGYDADRGLLVTQPLTATRDAPDHPTASFVATYDRLSGADLTWTPMPRASYRAGGLAVAPSGDVWLGVDSHLDGLAGDAPERLASLDRAGVDGIVGLAIDAGTDTLLVADVDGEVVEVRMGAVR